MLTLFLEVTGHFIIYPITSGGLFIQIVVCKKIIRFAEWIWDVALGQWLWCEGAVDLGTQGLLQRGDS